MSEPIETANHDAANHDGRSPRTAAATSETATSETATSETAASEHLRILSLESRRASEIAALIRKMGGEPTVAPSMQEVPLDECPEVLAFGEQLREGEIDAIVFLTGVGATALLDRLSPHDGRDETIARIDALQVFIRGPKPAAVLKNWGVHVDVRAPEPNTWEDLVAAIDAAGVSLDGRTGAVQEYGKPNTDLHAALAQRGAGVVSVPVYRWQMPDDVEPLREAARGLCARRFDVLMITSAQQIRHLLLAADQADCGDALRNVLKQTPIASIGPTATQTLRELGVCEAARRRGQRLAAALVPWRIEKEQEETGPREERRRRLPRQERPQGFQEAEASVAEASATERPGTERQGIERQGTTRPTGTLRFASPASGPDRTLPRPNAQLTSGTTQPGIRFRLSACTVRSSRSTLTRLRFNPLEPSRG